jgi:hypothetical protein
MPEERVDESASAAHVGVAQGLVPIVLAGRGGKESVALGPSASQNKCDAMNMRLTSVDSFSYLD